MPQKGKGKQTHKAGRPGRKGKYDEWLTEEGLLKIGAWSRDGLTQEDIAHNCGCSVSTFKEWVNRFPALAAVYKNARAVADIRVENALYKRATGYEYEEVTREEGPKGVTVRYVTKHVPPSEVAAFFWLKNRKPDVWRDKPVDTTDHSNAVEVTFDVDEEEEASAESADPAAEPES